MDSQQISYLAAALAEAAAGWLGLPPIVAGEPLSPDRRALEWAAWAVASWAPHHPGCRWEASGDPAGDTMQGLTMLTARLVRRRNSIGGVEPIGEGVTYVARTDPDVAMLLGLDRQARPVIG